jgi:predicted nucleic acid-binding protein
VIVVLDTSAAVRLVLQPAQFTTAAAAVVEAVSVLAPELIVAELVNTYWKYARAGQLTRHQADQALTGSLALIDEFCSLQSLCKEAMDLALQLNHPAYDMFFLGLARRRGAVLISADDSLIRLAGRCGIETPQ